MFNIVMGPAICLFRYSGRKITPSLSYVTIRGAEKLERARGIKTANSLSMYGFTDNFFPLNFDTVGGILIHWLVQYTVFCEPKERQNTANAGTRLNPHALLLQPKRNNFTSDKTSKDRIICPYVLSLRGLFLPPTCVVVTINEARSYFASTAQA
jgi:hypothetical protein